MSAAEEIKTYKNIPDVDGLPLLETRWKWQKIQRHYF